MVNGSVTKKRIIKSQGFSLLEVIFVLAFLGILLAAAATYARKLIDERTRQTAADAVAQEVYGMLRFVNTDSIKVSINNKTKNIINPLYQQSGDAISDDPNDKNIKGIQLNPLWLAHPGSSVDATSPTVSPYIARSYSRDITYPISNSIDIIDNGVTYQSHSMKWSNVLWPNASSRHYFTDSGCQGASGNVYFNQQFISCNESKVLHNSEIAISRIDFVSDKGTESRPANPSHVVSVGINRVDVYVSFDPIDKKIARIDQFVSPLITAFRTKKIMPNMDGIYLVRQSDGNNDNNWTLLNKTTGQPAGPAPSPGQIRTDLATYADLPDLVDKLSKDKIYALRFTFDGKGDYLRTDGLNSTTKLCWNTATGIAGPCLTSPSADALVLKRRDNPQEFANLQVNSVVSTLSHKNADGKTVVDEYYTAPRIQYKSFNNTGTQVGPYYKGGVNNKEMCNAMTKQCGEGPTSVTVADEANGAISIPLQTCPAVVSSNGQTIPMNQRVSVAISSVVSGIVKDENIPNPSEDNLPTQTIPDIFNRQDNNLKSLSNSQVTLNRLGGTVFQITKNTQTRTWRIASMVASEDSTNILKGKSLIYFNPSWLSVMVTTWCSSVDQQP
ncbi:type II secretion system protein [Proteus columbae]|uniref:pilus assembly FimT family protein n=1 Tax=Proteus columbae TaxID=1987580 RepID=UPI00288B4693|nr:type II secretion system protein [Proteus columbae]